MSGKAVGWAMEQRTGSPTTKLVLVKLADNANEWKAWPSVSLIAEDTELSERAVREHLRILEKLGLIKGEKRFQDGVQLPTIYQLLADSWVPRKAGERIPRAKKGGAPCAPPLNEGQTGHAVQEDGAPDAPTPGHEVHTNPYAKPLDEPSLSDAPGGASESVASLKPAEPKRFEEFRSAVALTWPDAFAREDEGRARAQFERVTRRVSADMLIACARQHGAAKTAERAARGPSSGKHMLKRPSNWLKDGDWEGYLRAAEDAKAKDDEIALALWRVKEALGPGIMEILSKRRIPDSSLAMLDGMTFDPGPPPVLTITKGVQRIILDPHTFALERALGEGLRIVQVAGERRSA